MSQQPLSFRDLESAVQTLRASVGYQDPKAAEAIAVLRQNALDVADVFERINRLAVDNRAIHAQLQMDRSATKTMREMGEWIDAKLLKTSVEADKNARARERENIKRSVTYMPNPYRDGTPRWRAFEKARAMMHEAIGD